MSERVGLWLIGARGGVATVASIGLLSLQQKRVNESGLVTALPLFAEADLVDWSQIVIGGHEIRDTTLVEQAVNFQQTSRAFAPNLVEEIKEDLAEIDQRVVPGILHRCGVTIDQLAESKIQSDHRTVDEKLGQIKQDLLNFKQENELARVVVINVSSTEPPADASQLPDTWEAAASRLEEFPISSLYSIAALQTGCGYVNFTPSLGSNAPAICQLAEQQGLPHSGSDGKTGETLIKSALAPAFAMRNLEVLSWVGHNIFGNMDGLVLDNPENKKTKVDSKDRLLGEILGYDPQTHISIEYIKSLGDWKTAWDHIHFQGFLGTPMVMQFTWQGCDSILASPLVLDLMRLTERAMRAKQAGVMSSLACFFKSPMAVQENNFVHQFSMLERWVKDISV
ncbi:MAG: myo-inositol-1-phosphate synthase [Planctomycetaceae bacterium]|nr:myo-inositol-1-phosphate synthase [Planctomycetaceae bacterium]MDG1806756.1 inositol-3-phosphate synthase [Pirellulaceae bacterium]MDG2103795.1 inositol-3-phosphate synthase [Pirellulaceae bacterium]